jgi:NADH:ubiquinone reductase (H+-translocating)
MASSRPGNPVVVIGCGFGGLNAVRRLAGKPVTVTLIDQHNFHTFQPLLYQVATAGLEPGDVAYPVRTIIRRHRNVTFRHGRVQSVDFDAREVCLADGEHVPYDHLIVGTGATAGFFAIPGAERFSHPLYTLDDANHLRNLVLTRLEEADAHHDEDVTTRLLVVGGGPTGVETAGALVELIKVSIRYDRMRIAAPRVEVMLVDTADRLLVAFKEKLGRYAAATLESRGVIIRLGANVAEVTPTGVRLESGESISAAVVVWAAGVTVDGTLGGVLPVDHGRGGRVSVGEDLSLSGHPEVFVVGDAGAVPRLPGGPTSPQLAQVAIQSGRHAARQVLRRLGGRPTVAFAYKDKGMMAAIGRRAAVTQLPRGLVLRGTIGWLAWLGLHLVYLIGFRNRVIVLVNWAWRYLNWPGGPRIIDSDVGGATRDEAPAKDVHG